MNRDGSNLGVQIVNLAAYNDRQRMDKPIVKDLTSHDMTTNSPAVFIALTAEPVVSQHLRIEIMCLEG